MFHDIPKQQGRLGAVSYPLIGVFPNDSANFIGEDDVQWIGIGKLKWAEQHVHLGKSEFPFFIFYFFFKFCSEYIVVTQLILITFGILEQIWRNFF